MRPLLARSRRGPGEPGSSRDFQGIEPLEKLAMGEARGGSPGGGPRWGGTLACPLRTERLAQASRGARGQGFRASRTAFFATPATILRSVNPGTVSPRAARPCWFGTAGCVVAAPGSWVGLVGPRGWLGNPVERRLPGGSWFTVDAAAGRCRWTGRGRDSRPAPAWSFRREPGRRCRR